MSERTARIRMPDTAAPDAEIEIRARLMHPMESGRRTDSAGARVPRDMLGRFICRFDGETVIEMELGAGVSADPFMQFAVRVPRSGAFSFLWVGDDGSVVSETRNITVT